MGSSKKHKEKDKEKERDRAKDRDKEREKDHSKKKNRSRSRSRSRERTSDKRHHRNAGSARKRRADDEEVHVEEKRTKEEAASKVKVEEDNQNNQRDAGDGNQLSLSIEETNKLRAKLGLKPLQVDGDENDNNKDENDKNEIPKPKEVFVKTENISTKIEAEKIKERLEIQRERRKIVEKLKTTKNLAEDDEEAADATAWVERSRKMQEEKQQAEKRARLLEEMDQEFGVSEIVEREMRVAKEKAYSAKHLKGLTVGHRQDAFQEGQQVILTLRDKQVLDEEEDVLENVNIIDEEKTKKNIENKIKKPDYKPYDEPEFDEFGILKKKSLLSKYDEEIEGVKKDSFKLGFENREKELEVIRMKLRQQEGKVTLELPELRLATEYYTPDEMKKFKKVKKVRKKVLRKKEVDFDLDELNETVQDDHGSRNESKSESTTESTINKPSLSARIIDEPMDINSVEDVAGIPVEEDEAESELQLALHKARKLKQRKNVTASTGADSIIKVVETVKKFSQNDVDLDDSNNLAKSLAGNIIMNRTAEFCRNLGDIPTYGLSGNREEDEDLIETEEVEENSSSVQRNQWNEVEMNESEENSLSETATESRPILEEEPDVSLGVAGALKLAMKKGYLDKEAKKQTGAPRLNRLQAQAYTIEEKFYEDDKLARRERYNGPVTEFRDKEGYKPDIKLDYVDDGGKLLDQKEAFRHLSHKFHGKGPGKNKIDKRMKKKEQESKLRQMSSIDTPLNTLKMLQDKQKELQSAYVVLTGAQKSVFQPTIAKSKK